MADSLKRVQSSIQDQIDRVEVLKLMFSDYSEDSREFGQCELGGITLILGDVQQGLSSVLERMDVMEVERARGRTDGPN
ncbi:MAG: hypothetical protein K9L59_10160 [Desulfobacterales bacterium]|nr:hypothetical protein [Desulfobacterales bacterium]